MYENHRKNFDRNDHRRDEERYSDDRWSDNRWRGNDQGWDREGGREQGGGRDEWRERNRDFGYASAFRDDDFGRHRGGYGSGPSSNWDRGGDYGRDRQQRGQWAQDARHSHGSGASHYGPDGRDRSEDNGNSRWFTGSQGSYAVDTPRDRVLGSGGYSGYGSDYRQHGYTGRGGGGDDRGFWDRATDEVASWFGDDDAARRREQDHRGRGPKDYTRSDERIREDANDRLTDDPRVDASSITLTVQDGEITLNGTVPSREEKRRAEDAVDRLSGVKHVQNNLRVQAAGSTNGDYAGNWATNRVSTAEGGTISHGAQGAGNEKATTPKV